jgi:signal transduction histidine kinase
MSGTHISGDTRVASPPQAETAPASPHKEAGPVSYEMKIRNSRILLVDDVVSNLTLLENVLGRLGYKDTKSMTDSRDVFAVVQDWRPDLIILDLAMPHVSGFEVMDVLRNETPREEWMPILVLSANADAASKRKALAAGAAEFVAKPFDSSEMNLRIRSQLLLRILQAELREQNRDLEARVQERTKTLAERTVQLEVALEKLESTQKHLVQQERFRAFGEMAGGVAHDFNNVLNCVIGYTGLILGEPSILDDKPTVMEFIQAMHTAGQDASKIVGRLRNFYRPRDESEFVTTIRPNGLMEEVVALTQPKWKLQALAAGRKIDMRLALGDTPPLACNAAEIREVMMNLVFNAVDAMPQGGEITLLTECSGDTVSFGVRDSGTGMSEEVRQRCMEPFFTTKGENGTGLGLAMVFGIVKRHEGILDIESEVGKGTTMWVRLKGQQGPSGDASPEEHLLGTSLRILTVDDEPVSRDVLFRYLSADGHIVTMANGPKDAFQRMEEQSFDLVITDQAMPEMNGTELALSIKHYAPNQPIILLTGSGEVQFDSVSPPPYLDRIVTKPFSQSDLRNAITGVMAMRLEREPARA